MSGLNASEGRELADKYAALQELLRGWESVLVAFSGGVDSALALRAAVLTLGPGRVLAVTGRSPAVPESDIAGAADLAAELGARHIWLDTEEFTDENYVSNPTNRCYHCKTELYGQLAPLARREGLAVVINGVNVDDLGDYRPGLQAAGEHDVRAPLAECGLRKVDVRALAAQLDVPIHDKPAAPCLSSRVQYGERITPEKLRRIDKAEQYLRARGFRELRVRHHDTLARIEVPADEIARFADESLRAEIVEHFRRLGYQYVTLDLLGFRTGSMNEVLLGAGFAGGDVDG